MIVINDVDVIIINNINMVNINTNIIFFYDKLYFHCSIHAINYMHLSKQIAFKTLFNCLYYAGQKTAKEKKG